MRIGRFSIFFILSLAGLLFAQNSLWQDSNPYTENKSTGDVIRLQIEDRFILETDDTQDGSNRTDIRLFPDTQNLPFLQNSTQSKSIDKNGKARFRMRETLRLNLAVRLGQQEAGAKTYPIQGSLTFDIDSKPGRIQVSGEVDPRMIKNGYIHSRDVLNLSVRMQSETPFPVDNRVNLKPPLAEGATEAPPRTATLSAQERENIALQHLRRILGGLQ